MEKTGNDARTNQQEFWKDFLLGETDLLPEDIPMLKNQFGQNPRAVDRRYLLKSYNRNVHICFFEFNYESLPPILNSFMFLFMIYKNIEATNKSIDYIAVEDSMFGSPMICGWEFNANGKETCHINYGSLSDSVASKGDIVQHIVEKFALGT